MSDLTSQCWIRPTQAAAEVSVLLMDIIVFIIIIFTATIIMSMTIFTVSVSSSSSSSTSSFSWHSACPIFYSTSISLWSICHCVIVTVTITICVFVAVNDIVTTIIIMVRVVIPLEHQHGNIALQKTQQWHLSSDWTLSCWSLSARPSGNVDCHIRHQDDGDVDPDDHDDDGIAPDWQKDYSSLQVGHLH